MQGVTAARMRMKLHAETVTYNLPLEISFYLVSPSLQAPSPP